MTKLLLVQRFMHNSLRTSVMAAAERAMHTSAYSSRAAGSVIFPKKGQVRASDTYETKFVFVTSTNFSAKNRRFLSSAPVADDDDRTTIPFLLADIGEGIKEVELLQWFVQEGDTVKQFDRICEVQSDKATVEITSRYDGIVESLAGGKVGDMVQVGDPLLYIQVEGAVDASSSSLENPEASYQQAPEQKKKVLSNHDSSDNQLSIPHVASQFHLDSDKDSSQGTKKTSWSGNSGKFLATPAVRKLGMEYNLDLSTLVGSGPQGRVLKSDVITFLKESGEIKDQPKSSSNGSSNDVSVPSGIDAAANKQESITHTPYLQEDEVVTVKGYNRLMIQTMTASQEIPHMGYQDDFHLTKLAEYRKDLSPKISILAFVIKAVSLALKEYPIINASWKDIEKGEVTIWANHNLGVAMDTPRGLVVPVIKNCQDKSLVQIQEDLNELKEVAAAGKLTEEHLTGATFSISNIGSLGGGTYMNPLIVPPQAGIGALGTIQDLPRFDFKGNVVAAKIMCVSWAGDHRMFDGATLARFSNLCKAYLEDPVRMLVAMS